VYKYFAWDKFTNLRAELMMAPVWIQNWENATNKLPKLTQEPPN
jgi:hypothetical protein